MTNPFDAIAQSGATANPFDQIAQGARPPAAALTVAGRVAAATGTPANVPFAVRHPLLQQLFVEPIDWMSTGISTAVRNWADAATMGELMQAGLPLAEQSKGPVDMTRPIRTPDYYETYGEFITRRQAEGDPQADETVNKSMLGAAFLGSFEGGNLLKLAWPVRSLVPTVAADAAGTLNSIWLQGARGTLGRAGSFLAGEFLGGSIYGAIRPTDEGESRFSAVSGDAALFAGAGGLFGGATHYLGAGLSQLTDKLATRYRNSVRDEVTNILADINQELRKQGTSLGALPIDQQESFATAAYGQALGRVPSGELPDYVRNLLNDLRSTSGPLADEQLTSETDRALMAQGRSTPADINAPGLIKTDNQALLDRLAQDGSKIQLPAGDVSNIPEVPFTPERIPQLRAKDIERITPFKAPAKTELAIPSGFIEGAGAPERELFTPTDFSGGPASTELGGNEFTFSSPVEDVAKAYAGQGGRVSGFTLSSAAKVLDATATEESDNWHTMSVDEWHKLQKATAKEGLNILDNPIYGKLDADNPVPWETLLDNSTGTGVGPARDPRFLRAVKALGYDAIQTYDTGAFMGGDLAGRGTSRVTGLKIPSTDVPVTITLNKHMLMEGSVHSAATDVARTLEPRELLGGSPEGFQPTQIGAEVPLEVKQLAMMDAAVKDAVRHIKPMELASPVIMNDGKVIEALPRTVEQAGKPVVKSTAEIIDQALHSDLPSKELLHGLDLPVSNLEQVQASWLTEPKSPIVPIGTDDLNTIGRLSDKQVDALAEGLKRTLGRAGEAGFIAPRLMLGLTGAGIETFFGFNDNLSPGTRNVARVIGGLLLAGSLHESVGTWFKTAKAGRYLLDQLNPMAMMTGNQKELFQRYLEAGTAGRQLAVSQRSMLEKLFPDENSRKLVMYALDEMDPAKGSYPPEYHMLSHEQQQAALALNQMNLRFGQLLQQSGAIDQYVQNYVRHLLPPESFDKWRAAGMKTYPGAGGIAQQRQFTTIRELEAWAAKEGVPGPITDVTKVHPLHIEEVYNAIRNERLWNMANQLGMVQKLDAGVGVPTGNRLLKIVGKQDFHAPEAVAAALENISTPKTSDNAWLNAADTIKGGAMRAIMFWFWEHSLNAMRTVPLIMTRDAGFMEANRLVRSNDPILQEMAGFGVNLHSRPDYGIKAAGAFETALNKLSSNATVGPLIRAGAGLMNKQDKLLWDQLIPALQVFGYNTRMRQWVERTGGRYLPSSTEYIAAGRDAARFANVIAGRLPTELANPRWQQGLRLALFSPQWTTSRIALTANAGGELGDIISGQLNPKNAVYLPMKIRQMALMTAITYAGSQILSGKDPQFNPNTHKFYMKTGLRTPMGREVGVDLAGWWQDDLKLVGDPLAYVGDRLNPIIRAAGGVLSGRDRNGNDMTGAENLGNIMSGLGPLPSAFQLGARGVQAATGGRPISGAEALQSGLRALGAGNTSQLQRPMDTMIAEYSKKLLNTAGIPANDDRIFELSRLLRSNLLNNQPLIDGQVTNYLAYRRRSTNQKEPIAGKTDQLWQRAKNVIFNWSAPDF